MVAAIMDNDDFLLNWLKEIAAVRFSAKLCKEYQEVYTQGESMFPWQDFEYYQHEVYERALSLAADLRLKLQRRTKYGVPKI